VSRKLTFEPAFERNIPELDTGSWQVERVEEYIEAHLDAPFDIKRIAEVTDVSTRSIYRAFKSSRGYSPMAFARQRRLQKTRRILEGRATNQTYWINALGNAGVKPGGRKALTLARETG
jgi:AraC-like DNA-binding protein